MKINGLMIDASRLLEPQPYYYRLIEYMAGLKMNTLLFHFSDDYGCAIQLKGFESLAMPHAFTPQELKKLIAFASQHGIEVIPELETFGHTQYITDHPDYRHLFAGKRTRENRFNAIDPFNPETHALMKKLIGTVAKVFPSSYLHLGCDEVDLKAVCRQKGLVVETVWTGYVNQMIQFAHDAGKTPIIWADHVSGNAEIARQLRKDVVLMDWRYTDDIKDGVLEELRKSGFKNLMVAPSLACSQHRFFPTRRALENTDRMASFAKRHHAMGVINTIWCPWRYLQNSLYYGIAYSAESVRVGGYPDRNRFNRTFTRKVFNTPLTPALAAFLKAWPELVVDYAQARKIAWKHTNFSPDELRRLKTVTRLGDQALRAAPEYQPATHPEIWNAMVLSAQCAWLCAEGTLLRLIPSRDTHRMARYQTLLRQTRLEISQEWDRTRDPADPQKQKTRFPKHNDNYAIQLLKSLPARFSGSKGNRI